MSTAPQARQLGPCRLLSVGPIRVSSYLAMLYLGCVAGVVAGSQAAASGGLDPRRTALATILLLVPAFGGARMLYVLVHLSSFRSRPRRLWRRSDGGAALYGGLVAALACSPAVLVLAGLPFWGFWDATAVTMLVGLILTRVGCLLNGCCAGRETARPLGMWLSDDRGRRRRRWPAQMLEAGWAALLLAAVLAARPSLPPPGVVFSAVVAGYAVGRLVLERIREATPRERSVNLALSTLLLVSALAALAWSWPR